ncbi:hypothetical protein [Dasania marina]|uniref:hypothetical protein n=1 Tax=Dasania marina TaxID=471499 RepID=UPI0030D87DA4|tara:strand:+ start:75330 stop:75902 length:573 start_codon:yes stop_codon:yes gene_type:complete
MDEETKKAVAESMRKARALPRKHANFFNWHDKEAKELAICSELIQYLVDEYGERFDSIVLGGDPPDCIVVSDGQEVAIEIVELVDQAAIEKQIRSKHTYPDQAPWTSQRLTDHLNDLIQQKDNPSEKESLKKSYPRYITLIHTDEPELMAADFDRLFIKKSIKATDLVSEVYLIFSYDPGIEGYPVRRLV